MLLTALFEMLNFKNTHKAFCMCATAGNFWDYSFLGCDAMLLGDWFPVF